ncbi:tyrosine-type recombinase/integrase [Mycobacterium intracellulare]|uniref:tyrosine-type recombinase/integrase n=1 Tax=Mycobacterium intracellulare TaxID=1767 RepID=UPI000BAC1D69|nr:tyrosine-type recombinase/integrase [Mycobacterium intracellulare]ASX03436.1 transposase [Mycobacterium intracellulare subsp. chimaera]PBA61220.1 transposase [Mycobacterium intracellulare subsp. chimaera]
MTRVFSSRQTKYPELAAVASAADYVSLPFEQRYDVASQAFPDWLLAEPISFPRDHPTYGWGCLVPNCTAELANSNAKFLCVVHDDQYRDVSSQLTIEEFAQRAEPCQGKNVVWALVRYANCSICGPQREALIRGMCLAHSWSLRVARRRGQNEGDWLNEQNPLPAVPPCTVPRCVHDGSLFNFRGRDKARMCRTHRPIWRRFLRDNDFRANKDTWEQWIKVELRSRGMQPETSRGLVSLEELPVRLQSEIRYAIHRHSNTPRRSQWRPRHLQTVVDTLTAAGVETLSDPVVIEHAASCKTAEIKRIWADLPIFARSLSVTRQDAKDAGWFDPAIVGAAPFQDTQGGSNRRKVWDLTSVSQRWLRDVLWDHIEYLALETVGKRPSVGTVYQRIQSTRLLSKALRQLREDQCEHPELLQAADARAFKELWDLWYREQIPVVEQAITTPPTLAPLSVALRTAFTNGMRHVLQFGRQRDILVPSIDSFVLAFPNYPRPRNRPTPRPIRNEDFQLLVSEEALARLDTADTKGVGLTDIWLTHAYQGGRISETLRLRLGCIGMIGESQPYLWRDITKVKVIDYGMPCHFPVYQRLLQRQEITRAKLRRRYAKELANRNKRQRAVLEADWDKTMPLFPSALTNPDLRIPLSQSHFGEVFATWIEELGLKDIATHRTRATLATSLLNNGAPAALVRQMLGHFSEDALAHYARYSDDNVVRHLHQVWAAGPGMEKPGTVLMTPKVASGLGSPGAVADRIDLTVIPVEHGLCRYGPVVGGSACPISKNCSSGPAGPCEHFVLTGADLAYWERKRDAAYHFAEGAPSEEARDYILSEWTPWERVLTGLGEALSELGLLEAAEGLDLRSPMQDFFHPLFSTGWPLASLSETPPPPTTTPDKPARKAQ